MINSRQEITQYSDAREQVGFKSDRGEESYMVILEDIRNIITHIQQSSIQHGDGSPENTIESNNSQLYVDTTNQILFFNPVIGADTGWTAIN